MELQRLQLTANMQGVMALAQNESARRHNVYLDIEHLLLALVHFPGGNAAALFQQYGVDTEAIYTSIADVVGMERPTPIQLKGTSKAALQALTHAKEEADALGHAVVDSGHLLISLMQEPDGAVHEVVSGLPFTVDDARTFMRGQSLPPAPIASPAGRATSNPLPVQVKSEFVLVPERKSKPVTNPTPLPTSLLIGGAVLMFIIYLWTVLPAASALTFIIVLIGWVFSVTLHEFGHALVAYLGGDYTVKDKGYLSFNPLKYTHPLLSIVMPLVFLAAGGIGLPGGAVYIERHRLKNKWWGAAVSAAGPLANLLLALLLSIPFIFGLVHTSETDRILSYEANKDSVLRHNPDLTDDQLRTTLRIPDVNFWNDPSIWPAIAFLIMLQFTAVFLNLIPIPPLDGFGILEPYLGESIKLQLRQLGGIGFMLIFFLFMYVTPVQTVFWNSVIDTTDQMDVPGWMIAEGYDNFMFWRSE